MLTSGTGEFSDKNEREKKVEKCHLCHVEKEVSEVRKSLFLCENCENYLISLRKKGPLFQVSP